MSCGCGGLPPSITLRLRALELAVQIQATKSILTPPGAAEVIADASNFLRFLATDEQIKELDAAAKKKGDQSQDNGMRYRNAMLQFVPSAIPLREAITNKLDAAGVNTIGALAQWFPHQLVEHAKMEQSEVQAVSAALRTRGLSLGMNPDSLRDWILNGRSTDGKTTVQATA